MQASSKEKIEPLKIKIILPLVALIMVLIGVFSFINYSPLPTADFDPAELHESFVDFAQKKSDFDRFKLFVSQKKVTWDQGPSLADFLDGVEGSQGIGSVSLEYQIPVFISLADDWVFSFANSVLTVLAPMPTFGEAMLNPGSLKITYKDPVTADQEAVIQNVLKENLMAYRVALDSESRNYLEDQSRVKVQEFLDEWLEKNFSAKPDLKYQISFSGSPGSERHEEP